MIWEDDFLCLVGDHFSEMRLLVEGAIKLFEDELCPIYKLMREAAEPSALLAFDDIGTALYVLKQHVCQLQETHHREALRQEDVQKPI